MATPAAPLPSNLIKDLINDIEKDAAAAEKYGGKWAISRWVTMVSLLVLSALVAVEKTVTGFFNPVPTWINVVFILMSILVAIGTAYDQSAKPGTRWRLSAGYTAKFKGLMRQVQMIDQTDRDAFTRLDKEFQDLHRKWVEDTTI